MRLGIGLALVGLALPLWAQSYVLQIVEPSAPNLDFGERIASVGDLDGDGIGDLALPATDLQHQDDDQLLLVSGATGAVLQTWKEPWDGYGMAVAGLGDVNQDGVPDIAVGAPWEARVLVQSGMDGEVLATAVGPHWSYTFGTSLAGLGDTNGDGGPDFVVGAPLALTPTAVSSVGAAFILSGRSAEVLQILWGTAEASQASASVAAAGDADGDGVTDVLVGAPAAYMSVVFFPTGSVLLFSSASGALLMDHHDTTPAAAFGSSVAAMGDLDGDLVPDFAAGSPAHDGVALDAGHVSLHSGLTGALLSDIPGTVPGERFGQTIANVGDVDGDGRADLAVGSPSSSCSWGAVSSRAELRSSATGALLALTLPSAPEARMGMGLAAVGDVSGDDVPDFAVGAPGCIVSGGGFAPGYVRIVSGQAGSSTVFGTGIPGSGGFVPQLEVFGNFEPGGSFTLRVTEGLEAAPGVLWLGREAASLPFFAGTLLLEPLVTVPHVLAETVFIPVGLEAGNGSFDLVLTLPPDPVLAGLDVYAQGAWHDNGVPQQVSLSNAVHIILGG